MTVLEQAILATDLASYFEKRDKFRNAADDGEIDWQVSQIFYVDIYIYIEYIVQCIFKELLRSLFFEKRLN